MPHSGKVIRDPNRYRKNGMVTGIVFRRCQNGLFGRRCQEMVVLPASALSGGTAEDVSANKNVFGIPARGGSGIWKVPRPETGSG